MSGIQVPILCLMIGEGGSGGALALAVGNEVWMMENATYSILSPEGFASILWKDGKRAKEAATVMKITAQDLKELSVVDKGIPEYGGADDDALTSIAAWMKGNMKEFYQMPLHFLLQLQPVLHMPAMEICNLGKWFPR